MEKTDLSEMKKEEFETIAEILHTHGIVGLRDYYEVKNEKETRRRIIWASFFLTAFYACMYWAFG